MGFRAFEQGGVSRGARFPKRECACETLSTPEGSCLDPFFIFIYIFSAIAKL